MTTQAQSSSRHLGAARELLDRAGRRSRGCRATRRRRRRPRPRNAILVLAEQVAVARVLLAGDALAAQRANGQETAARS